MGSRGHIRDRAVLPAQGTAAAVGPPAAAGASRALDGSSAADEEAPGFAAPFCSDRSSVHLPNNLPEEQGTQQTLHKPSISLAGLVMM